MRRAMLLRRRLSTTGVAWRRPGAFDYLKETLESRVYDVAVQTPLAVAPALSASLGAPHRRLLLKREDLQTTFASSIRGAYNKMAQLSPEQRARGIVACAAGNHLQGVAHAAEALGIDAIILTPVGTAQAKIAQTAGNASVQVIEHGADFDAALQEATRRAQRDGRSLIHPFDDPLVIAGNGTVGMEILKETAGQWPAAIFAPVGGGGLIAGIAAYVKEVAPSVRVIGVEPEGANLLALSRRAGHNVRLDHHGVNRFTDDVGIRTMGEENHRLCAALVDDVVTVSTDEICSAIKDVFADTRALVEPIGAIAVAGAKKYAATLPHSSTGTAGATREDYVAVLAAANMDFDRLRFVAERSDDRERFMAVTIPEVRGAFQRLYDVIYPRNVTEFTYRMTSARAAMARICMSIQTPTPEDFAVVLEAINAAPGMSARDLQDNELAKSHLRHLLGGRRGAEPIVDERLFRLEFPERPGALKDFLDSLRDRPWNVSLFHYRNHGADIGRVLVAFQVPGAERRAFETFLADLAFTATEETANPAYTAFLR